MDIKTTKMKKAMFLIVFTIFIWWLFENFRIVLNLAKILFEVMIPFIIALAIAFVINKPMSFIENKLFVQYKLFEKMKFKYKRTISLLITLSIFGLGIVVFSVVVVPNLVDAIKELADKVPVYFESLQKYAETNTIGGVRITEWLSNLNLDELTQSATNFLKGGFLNIVGSTFGAFTSVFGLLMSIILGVVFAMYFLLQKEELILIIKKLTFATLPLNVAKRLVYISRITKESFSNFITGQSVDALLVGVIFFISMLIFSFPYAFMISVIIAITALIPIVGAFIGLAIGAFLIFVQDPQKALYFIILFLVIQQVEGDLVYPKVVGDALGLSSIWILAAVAIGGGLFGIVGIILFVPMFSVIKKLLQEYLDNNLDEEMMDLV